MIAAFFHDERFARDASGSYLGTGALPYHAFARYLRHFDRVVIVARLGPPDPARRTVASGEGLEFACVESDGRATPRYVAALARRVREVLARADCAIARLPSLVGAVACHEALRTGKPFLVEVVADAFDVLWNHGSAKGKLAALALHAVTRRYVRSAPFAIYVTRATLQRRYPTRGASTFASNVLIAPPRPEVLERRLARISARGGRAPLALGLVGSYDVGYKGHETALRAVALLDRPERRVTLRCIGVGDPARWRARAEALAVEQRVELDRALPQGNAVLGWMDRLDVLVVPSLTEGLPRSLIEAMSCALPAVGSRVGGIPELLAPRALHRPGDSRDLARAIADVVGDPETMRAQARRNWGVAHEYSAELLEQRRDALVSQFRASIPGARPRAPRPAGGRALG